jgi:bla regulator protein blaR1
LTHIARGDLWLGCVPALAERLFFFHPLVHLAAREYVFWRESACDAAVIETLDAAPHEYGRLLLDLGVASPRASLAAAGASWSFSNLKRRIHMLGDLPRASRTSRLVAAGAVLLTLCASVPLRLVARTSAGADAPQSVPPAAQAQAAQPAAPKVPAPPKPPREPVAVRAQDPESGDLTYVVLMAGKDGERVHISGSTSDIARARSLRRGDEPLLWFRDRRGEFVIRDASVLAQIEAIWKPVGELGARQGRLGGEQGKLGSKMGELGAKQGLIGAEQGRLGAKQGALGAKQGALGARQWNASDAQRAEIEKAQRDLEADMRALESEMKALEVRMREFEKPMRDLGAEMETVGKEMETLGRQLEQEATRARAELRALLDRAVASGAAQPVK